MQHSDEKSAEAQRWHDEAMRLYEECKQAQELAEEHHASDSQNVSLVAELRGELAHARKENERLVESLVEAKAEAQRNAAARDDLTEKMEGIGNAHGGFLELEVEKRKLSVRRIAMVAHSMMEQTERKAWQAWLRADNRVKDAKNAVAHLQAKSDAQHIEATRRLKRVVATVRTSRLRVGWHTWRQKEIGHMQAQTKLQQARKVVGRISTRQQAAAWKSWVRFVERAWEEAKVMKKLLGRVVRLKEAIGFSAWRQFIYLVRQSEAKAASRAKLVRKVLATVVSCAVARGLRKWRVVTNKVLIEEAIAKERLEMSTRYAKIETERKLKRVMVAICSSQLRKGWRQWRHQEMRHEKNRTRLRRARLFLESISLKKQAAAWNSWIGVVKHAREEEKVIKSLLGRILRHKEALGLHAWKQYVLSVREAERLAAARAATVRKVVANVTRRAESHGFRQWRNFVSITRAAFVLAKEQEKLKALLDQSRLEASRKDTAMRMKRVVSFVCLSRLRVGWQSWRKHELARERAQFKLRRARKVLARVLLATHAAAWRSWIGRVKLIRASEKATKKLLGRILRFKQAVSFQAWKQFAVDAVEAERVAAARKTVVRKVVANVVNTMAVRSLRRWRDVVKMCNAAEERATVEAKLLETTAKAQQIERQLKLKRFSSSIRNFHLRTGWHMWKQRDTKHTIARKNLQRAQKVLARISLMAQTSAFTSWVQFVKHSRDTGKAMRMFLGRIARHRESAGISTWQQYTLSVREAERSAAAKATAIRKVAAKVVHGASACALRQWRDVVLKLKVELGMAQERLEMSTVLTTARAEAQKNERDRKLQRVARAVYASHLRKGWQCWRHKALGIRQAEAKLRRARKVLGCLSLKAQNAAWNSWVVHLDRAREEERVLKSLLGRILRHKEAMGFQAWALFVANARGAEHLAARRAATVRKVVASLAKSTIGRALRRWRQVANTMALDQTLADERAKMELQMAQSGADAKQREAQMRLKSIVCASSQKKLRKGWRTWMQVDLFQTRAQAKVQRARKVLGKVSLAAQAAAWNTWVGFIANSRKEQRAMEKLLVRILRHKEAMGFQAWAQFIANVREVEQLAARRAATVRKVVANVTSRRESQAIRHWRDYTKNALFELAIAEEREKMRSAMAQSSDASRNHEMQQRLKHILRSARVSHQRNRWHTWRQKVLAYRQARSQLQTAQKVLRSIVFTALSAAWNSWTKFVECAQEEEVAIQKLLSRILRHKEAVGFQAWTFFVANAREAESLAAAKAISVRKVTANVLNGTLACALRQWRDVAKKLALEASRSQIRETKMQSHMFKLSAMLSSKEDKAKLRSFWHWYRSVATEKESLAHRYRSVKRLLQLAISNSTKKVSSSFTTWRKVFVLQRQAFQKISRVLSRKQRSTLHLALRTWEQFVRDQDLLWRTLEERNRAAKTLIRVWHSLHDKPKSLAFLRWCRQYRSLKESGNSARAFIGALRVVHNRRLACALTAWLRYANSERISTIEVALAKMMSTERALAIITHASKHFLWCQIARAFRAWHGLTHELWAVWCSNKAFHKRRQLGALGAIAVRCRRLQLVLHWLKWRKLHFHALALFQSRVLANKKTQKRIICRRLVVSMRSRPLRIGLFRLAHYAHCRRLKLAKSAVVVQWLNGEVLRLHLRRTALSWKQWRQVVDDHRARLCGLQAAMRAGRRRNARDLAACFARWICFVQECEKYEVAMHQGVLRLRTLIQGVEKQRLCARWVFWKQLLAYESSLVKVHHLESRVVALLKEIGGLNQAAAAYAAGNYPVTLSLVNSGREALAAAWSAIGELQVSSNQSPRYSSGNSSSSSMPMVRQHTQAMVVMADRKAATFEAFAVQAQADMKDKRAINSDRQEGSLTEFSCR